jgi:hypothetical protein
VGIADDPGYARESGEIFRGALGVTAGDNEASVGILRVDFADRVASLSIGGRGDGASVYDNEIGGVRIASRGVAAGEQLAFEGGAVGVGGPATELLNVKSRHQ